MKALAKTIAGLLAIGLVIYGVEHFLSPLPHLSADILVTTPIDKLTLLFEAMIVIVVLSGFVVQQFLHHCKVGLGKHDRHEDGAARWSDLLFVFVAVFGSAFLYLGFVRVASL